MPNNIEIKKAPIKRIFFLFWQSNKFLLLLGVSLFLVASGGMLYNQVFIGKVVVDIILQDYINVTKTNSTASFNWDFFALVIVLSSLWFLISVIFKFVGNWILSLITFRTTKKIQDDLYYKIQKLPMDYLNKEMKGSIIIAFNSDIETLKGFFRDVIPNILNSILTLSVSIIIMFSLNWQLSFIMLGFLALIIITSYFIMKRSKKAFASERKNNAIVTSFVEESLSSFTTTKIFNNSNQIIDKYLKLNREYKKVNRKSYKLSGMLFPVSFNIGLICYGTIAMFGSILFINGDSAGLGLTIGTLVSFTQFSKSFASPVSTIMMRANDILKSLEGSRRIFAILDYQDEIDQGMISLTKVNNQYYWINQEVKTIKPYQGLIEFENVSFAYKEIPALENITFKVMPGQKVALVGKTGAGKTTIVNLLGRFYEVSSGNIFIDQINIKEIKKSCLRNLFGFVLQDIQIFSDTLTNNIAYGTNLPLDRNLLTKAIDNSNLTRHIAKLPHGTNSYLSSYGLGLSQGQKQLISIARVNYKKPQIIILDEATSNVDSLTELEIQKSMDDLAKKTTTISIAHRLSTIINSDLIIVIDQGKILEQGTHNELISLNGKYKEMIQSSNL